MMEEDAMPQWEYANLRWDHSLPIPRMPPLRIRGPFGIQVGPEEEEEEPQPSGCWVVFTHHDTWELSKEDDRWEVLKLLGEQGWELASTDRDERAAYYHFKRPLQATEGPIRPIGFKTTTNKPEA